MPRRIRYPLAAALVAALFATGCGDRSGSGGIASARERLDKGDFAGAVIELKGVLQATPNAAEARFLLGTALLEDGQFEAAAVEFTKAEEIGFNSEQVAPKLARAMLGAGRVKDVVATYRNTVLTSAEQHAELRAAVATAYGRLDQTKEAESAVDDALRAAPTHVWALLTKARILASTQRFDEALQYAEQSLARGGGRVGEAHLLKGYIFRSIKRDPVAANKAFELAAQDRQSALPARTALLQAALGAGQFDVAKSQLAELKKAYPKHPQVHFVDALLSYAQKDFQRAEQIIDLLLRQAPSSAHLLTLGGAASLQRGSLIAAEAKLGKVVQTTEGMPVARKLLAETYVRMGQSDKALHVLRPALDAARIDPDAQMLAGQAHLQAGRLAEAETHFAVASKAKPGDVQVRTALALADLAKGQIAAAYEALQEIAEKDAGDTADVALISAHLRRGEVEPALLAIARLERKSTGKPTPAHLRGVALRSKGDAAGARAAFADALKLDPRHFVSTALLVAMDMADGQLDKARERLEGVVKLDPANATARLMLVDVLSRQKSAPQVVLAAIDEAIKSAPTEAAPRVARILHLTSTGSAKEAAASALEAIAALPANADVLDAAGKALAASGDDQQAISAFNKLIPLMPRSPLPYLRLADVYGKRGDLSAVGLNLGRAFDVAPTQPEVHRRMVAHARQTKDFRPPRAAARDLQKRLPNAAVGFLLEGDVEAARRAWPEALLAYRSALGKSDPEGRPPKLVYSTLRASGQVPEAERFAAGWMSTHVKDAGFREYLANSATLRGDLPAAEKLYREVIALQPGNAGAMNNLAWIITERDAGQAVELAQRALAITPEPPPVLDTLARALLAQGQLVRAIETQRKAVAAMPSRTQYRVRLAQMLSRQGDKDAARRELVAIDGLGDRSPAVTRAVAELRQQLGN